jgi:hypothetical protein
MYTVDCFCAITVLYISLNNLAKYIVEQEVNMNWEGTYMLIFSYYAYSST